MNHAQHLRWVAILTCLAGCVSVEDRQLINVPLAPNPYNAGQIGQATLAADGNETSMSIFISGVPSETTRPVHIYTFIYTGNCKQRMGAAPAYALNQRVLAEKVDAKRGWTLSRRVPAELEALRTGTYSIVLRTGPADGNREIFCGEIG
ncbi:hypothetical protein FQZ97_452430 [compost metagenome]